VGCPCKYVEIGGGGGITGGGLSGKTLEDNLFLSLTKIIVKGALPALR